MLLGLGFTHLLTCVSLSKCSRKGSIPISVSIAVGSFRFLHYSLALPCFVYRFRKIYARAMLELKETIYIDLTMSGFAMVSTSVVRSVVGTGEA